MTLLGATTDAPVHWPGASGHERAGRSKVAFVSFRLGGTDGVAVAAAIWMRAFRELGFDVTSVAGGGSCDAVLPWLAIGSEAPPEADALDEVLEGVDLVVVENLLTIPLNVPASRAVARVLRGRPALVHHHDPPWHRPSLPQHGGLPRDDPSWRHVTISRSAQREFAERGIDSVVVHNGFDIGDARWRVDRATARASLGLPEDGLLFLHPVRAIERKAIPVALAFAQSMNATYWLTGPAEDGYDATLRQVLGGASVPVLHRPVPAGSMALAYAAADCVLYPSLWEGFGNVPIEAALSGRPVTVGSYPVASELRELGFRWTDQSDPGAIAEVRELMADGDHPYIVRNREIARRHFSYEAVRDALGRLASHFDGRRVTQRGA